MIVFFDKVKKDCSKMEQRLKMQKINDKVKIHLEKRGEVCKTKIRSIETLTIYIYNTIRINRK